MAKDDGGPAFPTPIASDSVDFVHSAYNGMSLRDWVAGQCAAAFVAANARNGVAVPENIETIISRASYALADAMIAERDK